MGLLQRFDPSKNQLRTIDKSLSMYFDEQLKITNFSLNLDGNNFICDCENIGFLKWISESHVDFENIDNYMCYYGDDRSKVGNLSVAKDLYQGQEKSVIIIHQ